MLAIQKEDVCQNQKNRLRLRIARGLFGQKLLGRLIVASSDFRFEDRTPPRLERQRLQHVWRERRRRGLRKLLSRPGQRHNRQKQLKSKPVRCAHQGRRRLLPFTNNFRRAVRPASTILDYI